MNEQDIQGITALLSTPKKIVIIPHRSPDGDAMGSTLAMYHFLIKLGHSPTVIAPNEFPGFLAFLPASETVLFYEKERAKSTKILEDAELIFVMDFNASVSIPVSARMASIVSGITIAWLSTT